MGTAIKHQVPVRVKPSFVIFDILALWRRCTHMASVGVKGLNGYLLTYLLIVLHRNSSVNSSAVKDI